MLQRDCEASSKPANIYWSGSFDNDCGLQIKSCDGTSGVISSRSVGASLHSNPGENVRVVTFGERPP